MDSERLQRHQQNNTWMSDEEFCERIRLLLNHPDIKKYCMVDAFYYDFSVLPEKIKDMMGRDAYLCFGITKNAEIVSKWVDRYDLDSRHPIVDGNVIHPKFDPGDTSRYPPPISQTS